MSQIDGAITVINTIKAHNNLSFAVVEDIDVWGGLQVALTLVDRDAIPAEKRKIGMFVSVVEDGKLYRLMSQGPAVWMEFSGGGGAAFSAVGSIQMATGGAAFTNGESIFIPSGGASAANRFTGSSDPLGATFIWDDTGLQVDTPLTNTYYVTFNAGMTAAQMATALHDKINAISFGVTASISPSDTVNLTNDLAGSEGALLLGNNSAQMAPRGMIADPFVVATVNGQRGHINLDSQYDQNGAATAAVNDHETALNPHPQYVNQNDAVLSVAGVVPDAFGDVTLTPADIGAEDIAAKGLAGGYAPLDTQAYVDPVYVPLSWIDEQFYFGDGTDGNGTFAVGVTSLVRTMYYNDLTVSGTGQVAHQNNAIFVAGTYIQSTSASPAIRHSFAASQNGGAGNTAGGVGAAGTNTAASEFAANTGGVTGAGSSATVGTGSPNAPAALAVGAGGTAGASGAGGAGAGGAGGTNRASNGITVPLPFHRPTDRFQRGITLVPGGQAGVAGAGGGGNGVTSGGGGGGSGAAGSMGFLAARTMDVTSATTPIFSVEPGSSGAGGTSIGVNWGGGGGAGGSGGGWLTVIVKTVIGSLAVAFVASGGAGGAGGNGNGTGVGGNGGSGGAAGTIKMFDLGRRTVTTQTQTVAPVAGGAASGTTGGTGGAGGVCTLGLTATP